MIFFLTELIKMINLLQYQDKKCYMQCFTLVLKFNLNNITNNTLLKDKHFVKDIFFSTTTLFNYLIIYQNTKRRDYGY